MSEMIDRDSLDKVLKVLRSNTKLSSPKSLAAKSNTTSQMIETIIEFLKTRTYVIIDIFPKGTFKSFGYTYYGKGFIYSDGHVVVNEGRTVEGSFSRAAKYLGQRTVDRYRDLAIEKGILFIEYRKFYDTLLADTYLFVNKDYLETQKKLKEQEELDGKYKVFTGYPRALAYFKKTELELEDVCKKIEELETVHTQLKTEYEKQLALAKSGQRTKQEAYSVQTGKFEEIPTGSYHQRAWFDDEGPLIHTFETVSIYETRYRTVVDTPKEPVYQTETLKDLKYKQKMLDRQLSYIKSSVHSTEKSLAQEEQEAIDRENYKKEKAALDAKYKNRF